MTTTIPSAAESTSQGHAMCRFESQGASRSPCESSVGSELHSCGVSNTADESLDLSIASDISHLLVLDPRRTGILSMARRSLSPAIGQNWALRMCQLSTTTATTSTTSSVEPCTPPCSPASPTTITITVASNSSASASEEEEEDTTTVLQPTTGRPAGTSSAANLPELIKQLLSPSTPAGQDGSPFDEDESAYWAEGPINSCHPLCKVFSGSALDLAAMNAAAAASPASTLTPMLRAPAPKPAPSMEQSPLVVLPAGQAKKASDSPTIMINDCIMLGNPPTALRRSASSSFSPDSSVRSAPQNQEEDEEEMTSPSQQPKKECAKVKTAAVATPVVVVAVKAATTKPTKAMPRALQEAKKKSKLLKGRYTHVTHKLGASRGAASHRGDQAGGGNVEASCGCSMM